MTEPQSRTAAVRANARRVRTLIIDDMPAIRLLLRELLHRLEQHSGGALAFDMEEAEDAGLAWDRLWSAEVDENGSAWDLVLVDQMMPGRTGVELIRALRSSRGFESTAMLMITSESSPAIIEDARLSGADGYLVKPFSTEGFSAEVGRALRERWENRRSGGTAERSG